MAGSISQRNRIKKIISVKNAISISKKIRSDGKTVVIVGGCFDILHLGHILFLEKAKKEGDYLFILLESDETIKKWKGENRPINSQKDRAYLLSKLEMIDFIIPLKEMTKDAQYDKIIFQLKPDVLATTKGDPNVKHKERQAKLIGTTKLRFVIKRVAGFSSTRFASNHRRQLN